jgi:hypothetical protein
MRGGGQHSQNGINRCCQRAWVAAELREPNSAEHCDYRGSSQSVAVGVSSQFAPLPHSAVAVADIALDLEQSHKSTVV